jgi:hypothetical protein
MSAVSLGDQAKALALIDGRSSKRDQLLIELAGQHSWTNRQRALVERMWQERQQRQETQHGH